MQEDSRTFWKTFLKLLEITTNKQKFSFKLPSTEMRLIFVKYLSKLLFDMHSDISELIAGSNCILNCIIFFR